MTGGYLKIGLILILALALVLITSAFVRKGYNNYYKHKSARTKEIFSGKTNYDVLYIGSSRMHNAVNPAIVDSITGFSSYNAGVEGGNMFEFRMTFDGFLESHPIPRFLVFSVDAKSFDINKNLFFPPQYFESLDNAIVNSYMDKQEEYNRFFIKYIPFSRLIYYDDFTKIRSVSGLMGRNEMQELKSFEYNGFLSNGNNCVDTTSKKIPARLSFQFQQSAIACLQEIIQTCNNKKIKLILTYSPEYAHQYQRSVVNFSSFVKLMDSITNINDLQIYWDDNLSLCKNPCNFANVTHLNTTGASLYSEEIGLRIKNIDKVILNKAE